MDCQNEKNRQRCNCTYEPCFCKGNCCACVAYHKDMGEFPACFFTNRAERTYDRSFAALVRDRG